MALRNTLTPEEIRQALASADVNPFPVCLARNRPLLNYHRMKQQC